MHIVLVLQGLGLEVVSHIKELELILHVYVLLNFLQSGQLPRQRIEQAISLVLFLSLGCGNLCLVALNWRPLRGVLRLSISIIDLSIY